MIETKSARSLLVSGLICANVVVFLLSAYSLSQSRQQHLLRAETQTRNVATALDQSFTNSIDRIDLGLHAVVDELEHQLAGKRIDEAAMTAFLTRLEKRLPEVEAFRIADARGHVIIGKGVDKVARASWADREYFVYHREHADDSMQVAKPRLGRVAKKHIVGFSRRYNYPDGSFAGVVSAPIAVEHFVRTMSGYDLGPNGTFVLRDLDAGLVARFPPLPDKAVGQVGNSAISPELRAVIDSGVRDANYFTPFGADGFTRIVSFRRLSNAPMLFIAAVASDDYLAGWMIDVYKTLALAGGFLVLSSVLGIFLLRLMRQAEAREQVLSAQEAQLRSLIEAVPDMIVLKDGESRWRIANSVSLRIFGLEGQSWQGLNDAEISAAHPHLAAALAECRISDEAAWTTGLLRRVEERVPDREGHVSELEVIKVPLFDATGQRRAMVIVGRDIAERRRKDEELAQHRHHLEALVEERTAALLETEARASHILESSAAGLFGTDTAGLVTFINPAACAMLGHAAAELVGRSAHALFHHSRADGSPYPDSECPSLRALINGERVRVDNDLYWRADGAALPVIYETHPIIREGKVTGAVTSFIDVSEQRAAAQAREVALAAAENLARVRREFLANMSHEIRTPLNGVLGFADIGRRNSGDPQRAHDAFEKILSSGRRLLGVINDILDFSKIEAGKLNIEQTAVNIQEVVGHAVELVQDRAAEKKIELTVALAPDLPAQCQGDPLRLGQVLINLLSNAVKFTETGSVELSVSRVADRLLFRVTDSGIGMSAVQIGELFNPFQQADASATRRFGGTGLGLAISKRILELMGGDIRVESQLGHGTTVSFNIPFLPATVPAKTLGASAAAPLVRPAQPLAGVSVLVVEDDPINQMVLDENLRDDGAQVVVVANGREAIERVLADGRDAFDIVLMDLQMPEMDGYEATRSLLELSPELPIIAQSAHAFAEERERCLAAGMVDHIAKPVEPDKLLAVMLQHLAKT